MPKRSSKFHYHVTMCIDPKVMEAVKSIMAHPEFNVAVEIYPANEEHKSEIRRLFMELFMAIDDFGKSPTERTIQ